MRAFDLRTERDHVEPGDLLAEQPAFEPRVDRRDVGLPVPSLPVDLAHDGQGLRVQVRLPAGIPVLQRDRRPGERRRGAHLRQHVPQSRRDARAARGHDTDCPVVVLHHREVVRRLDEAGDVRAHREHAMRKREEELNQPVAVGDRENARGIGAGAPRHLNCVVDLGQLDLEARERLGRELLNLRSRVRLGDDDGLGFARDRVVLRSAGDRGEVEGDSILDQGVKDARDELQGVPAILDDVEPGVSAAESRDRKPQGRAAKRRGPKRGLHVDERVFAPRAADKDHAVLFGVEVQEHPARQYFGIQVLRPGQAGFFVEGEEKLEGTVLDARVGCGRQRGGNADPVVGAERRSGRLNPLARQTRTDRVPVEIVHDVPVLLAHHVEVRLQDQRRCRLAPRRGGDPEDHVAARVAGRLRPDRLADGRYERDGLLLVAGRTGDRGQRREMAPDGTGRKIRKNVAHGGTSAIILACPGRS